VHDSQELDGLLHKGNTCNDVFADSAYRSAEISASPRGQMQMSLAGSSLFKNETPKKARGDTKCAA
jgi:hypothetical protein